MKYYYFLFIVMMMMMMVWRINGVRYYNSVDIPNEINKVSDSLRSELINSKKSSCWMEIWKELPEICSKLDDQERKFLGYQLTTCHFDDAGIDIGKCNHLDINECLAQLANSTLFFEIYTKYFLNGISLCYIYETQKIKERVDAEVSFLLDSATATSRLLTTVEQTIDRTNGEMVGLSSVFDKFFTNLNWLKKRTNDVESIFRFAGKNLDFVKSSLFYLMIGGVAFLLTSNPRTAASRFWFLSGLTLVIVFELLLENQAFRSYFMIDLQSPPDLPDLILSYTDVSSLRSYVRVGLIIYLALSLTISFCFWKDLPTLNRRLIEKLLSEVELSRNHLYQSK